MDGFVIFLSVLVWSAIMGAITQYVAKTKGYEDGFWWGFFLNLIGLLVVGLRAEKRTEYVRSSVSNDYWNRVQTARDGRNLSGAAWVCANCGVGNPGYQQHCARCSQPRPNLKKGDKAWVCGCGARNRDERDTCWVCSKPRGAKAAEQLPAAAQHPEQAPPREQAAPPWRCGECGRENLESSRFCGSCGKSKESRKTEVFCDACGHRNLPEDRFCVSCGKQLAG